MKKVRFLTAALCTLLLLTVLTVPALAVEPSYWDLDAEDYFFQDTFTVEDSVYPSSLTIKEMQYLAIYLRELYAYAGIECFFVLMEPDAQNMAAFAPQFFADQDFGENALVLFWNDEMQEAAVLCGDALAAKINVQTLEMLEESLRAPDVYYGDKIITNPVTAKTLTTTEVRITAVLAKLAQLLHAQMQFEVPQHSFLSPVIEQSRSIDTGTAERDSRLTSNAMSAQELAQLTWLFSDRGKRYHQHLIVFDNALETELSDAISQYRNGLSAEDSDSTGVLAYSVETGVLAVGTNAFIQCTPGSAPYEALFNRMVYEVQEQYRNTASEALELDPVWGEYLEGIRPTFRAVLRANNLTGFVIAGCVIGGLILIFVIALLFRSQTKERKYAFLRPRGINMNLDRFYPPYSEPVETPDRSKGEC